MFVQIKKWKHQYYVWNLLNLEQKINTGYSAAASVAYIPCTKNTITFILPLYFSKFLDLRKSLLWNDFYNWNQQNSAKICLSKIINRNTRKRCEICSKLTIKVPDDVTMPKCDFSKIAYDFLEIVLRHGDLVLGFLLLTLNIFNTFF